MMSTTTTTATATTLTLISTFSVLITIANSRSVYTPNVCKLEPQSGPCYASHSRYYFNGATGNCETFTYGGCHGNGNNFMTVEDCQSMCLPSSQPLKRKTREVSNPPVQPSTEVTTEKQQTPSQQQQQEGQQKSPNETTTTTTPSPPPPPPPESISTTIKPNLIETESPTPPKTREEVCFQPFAEGNCKENLIRYYYDPEINKCEKFIFKGCFQYDNNFEKLEDCESLCVLPTSTPTPTTR